MNKSFTLIEILVVIVVIGIISAFILVGMSSITNKANIAKGLAFANSMRNSLLMNLVSEWKLDGNANDSWGAQNGSLGGTPTLKAVTDCVTGTCYSFSEPTSDYITIPHPAGTDVFDFGSKMGAFIWIRASAQNNVKALFSQYHDGTNNRRSWWFGSAGTSYNKIQVILSPDGTVNSYKQYTSSSIVFDGNWHLVGFTWDGTIADNNNRLKLYVDGQEIAIGPDHNDSFTSLYDNDVDPVCISCYWQSGARVGFFTGTIDDAKLYNAAIPTSRVQQNYFVGVNNLYKNNRITLNEFNQRLVELKSNMVNNE
jgi:prepilin-type N-terminal cleavage/methylation domain-containing protein